MDIPYEVLVYLFKYLPKSDRLAASETCRSWYFAANDKSFVKRKYATFYKTLLNGEVSPLHIFGNSAIEYCNYKFIEVEISSDLNNFWAAFGSKITSLTIKNCDICEKIFVFLIQNCPNIETLKVENCRELFMSGCLLEGKSEGLLNENLENLKVLSLSGNQYLSDALLQRFVSAAPELEELDLSSCSLQFHMGLVKKFYPSKEQKLTASESVLTFFFVFQFIISKATHMKRFSFSNTLIDGHSLKCLSEVKGLKLETLNVQGCDQLTNAGLLALTTHQTSLTELDIGLCSRVTDLTLLHISNNLINLEYLNIQRCRAVTDLGIKELAKLNKLKSLNISQCCLITDCGLKDSFCNEVNIVLTELDISCLNLDEEILILLSEKLPRLQSLNVSYCFNAITDKSIQILFQNLIYLHTLKMACCDKLSDAGLTGMGKAQNEEVSSTSVLSNNYPRIYLGSKAEEEIVRDSQRKLDVMKLCETINTNTLSNYTLKQLKSLRELDLSGCNKITDVSLIYAFTLVELVNLNLSLCQQITHEGMESLVNNCPSIECLNLNDCYNLNDAAIEIIAKGSKRLKRLELKNCNQLTDQSVEALKLHCTKLKYLDLQGCRKISLELTCVIGNLHNADLKPGPYGNVTEDSKPEQRSTFLPVMMRKLGINLLPN